MLTICHLTTVHQSRDIRIFVKQCSSLAKAGYEVKLLVTDSKSFNENNVEVLNVWDKTGGRLKRMIVGSLKMLKAAKKEDADLYHFHDPELMIIGLFLKWSGKKVIFDVHEDLPRTIIDKPYIKKSLRNIIAYLIEGVEDFCAKRFDAVVTATPYINNRFERNGCKAVNVNNFPIKNELWDDLKKEKSVFKELSFVGGMTGIRGVQELVDSLEYLDDKVRLNLVGRIYPTAFYKKLKKSKGWSKVIEHGQKSRKEVGDILSKSTLGVVTFLPLQNHINAQPNKMFEYMSAGIPVIGSNFPLWEDILIGNDCGVCVDPLNPKSIAEGISILINNEDICLEKGRKARKAIEEKYNWEIEEIKLIELYKELL